MFGKVLEINSDRLTVQFAKIMGSMWFKWPEMNDVSQVHSDRIKRYFSSTGVSDTNDKITSFMFKNKFTFEFLTFKILFTYSGICLGREC